jgi:hypothetical protein
MDQAVMALYLFTKSLKPFANATLKAAVDGEEIDLGEMTFAGEASKDGLTGMAYAIPLDHESLSKLARARRLEMSLGSIRFALPQNKINAIADFHQRGTSAK